MTRTLTPAAIAAGVRRLQTQTATLRDALNAADRVLGDGDTGMTVAAVIAAWNDVAVDTQADAGAALEALGRAGRRATGSSLGAVLATGLVAAGRSAHGTAALDRDGLLIALTASVSAITARSGAGPGDKTILDTLVALREALAAASPQADLVEVALAAATDALRAFHARPARIGRARVYGERAVGHDDPGMLAAAMLLQAATGRQDASRLSR